MPLIVAMLHNEHPTDSLRALTPDTALQPSPARVHGSRQMVNLFATQADGILGLVHTGIMSANLFET